MHIANTRIKNITNIETEIGQLDYFVPLIVFQELENLTKDEKKGSNANSTLKYIQNYKMINIFGSFADKAIIDYVEANGGIIATMDKELKIKVKELGGSIISIANDRIVLEK